MLNLGDIEPGRCGFLNEGSHLPFYIENVKEGKLHKDDIYPELEITIVIDGNEERTVTRDELERLTWQDRGLEPMSIRYSKTDEYLRTHTCKSGLRCPKCGKPLLKETNIKGYQYQCMNCDESFYEFEVSKNPVTPITAEERFELFYNTVTLLLLDED